MGPMDMAVSLIYDQISQLYIQGTEHYRDDACWACNKWSVDGVFESLHVLFCLLY